MSERFTAYLSKREREALRERAEQERSSENYIVRLALRAFLKLDAPKSTQIHA